MSNRLLISTFLWVHVVSCICLAVPLGNKKRVESDSPVTQKREPNLLPSSKGQRYWPQWRGPLASGVAPHADPPITWSESQNIRWKKALPGKGHSTPAVWGDLLFLTAAVPYGKTLPPVRSDSSGAHDISPITQPHRFVVIAIKRSDGAEAWKRTVREELPHEGVHRTASLASASPVTDGEHIYAYFGSRGLHCLDLAGEIKWQTDLGHMRPLHAHGEGSSPALHKDTLVVNWDHEGPSFLVAFDKHSGKQRWKVEREGISSWSSPLVVEVDGKSQAIVSGSKRIRGYDLSSGEISWECAGLSQKNVVATPVIGHGMVYAGSTYDKNAILAIRLDGAQGNVTDTEQVAWTRSRGAPYVPSPLLYGDALYTISHFQGILNRVNAHTGKAQPGQFRLRGIGKVFASPVGAAGRVYVTSRNGATIVLADDDELEILALNTLDDSFGASPVAVDGELYLRGEKNLYCIAEE